MHLQSLACCLSLACMALFVTPGTSYTAHASGTTKTLTPAETRALIGDTIPAKYFNGSQYVDFNFQYSSTWSITSVACEGSCLPAAGQTVLIYSQSGSISIGGSNSYIQVDLQPEYSLFDTEIIQQFIGVSSASAVSSATYQAPTWRWYMSTQGDKAFYNDNDTSAGSGHQACFYVGFDSSMPFTFVDADYTAQSTFSAYSYRALFYGNTDKNGHVYLAVSCPVVSADSTSASGTGGVTTGSSGGGSGDINVTVDMTETNGILDSILNAIEGVVDAIAGLFVPSEESLTDFKDDMQTLLAEHLGGLYDAEQAVEDYAQAIADADTTATDTIRFPALAIPLGSAVFRLGPYNIPLKPYAQDFSILWDALALAIDILVTTAFINMCRKKLEIFLHPDGEVIVS